MIAYLKGLLTEVAPDHAVVECSGVGYYVRISLTTQRHLEGKREAQVFTLVQTKEDGQTLFGFAERNERDVFELLISVQGVGGAVALALLSAYTPEALQRLVVSQDTASLKRVKGVGAKTAERIVLELKDKLGATGTGSSTPAAGMGAAVRQEALQALAALGYPKQQLAAKLDALLAKDPTLTVEALVKAVLRG